MSGQVISEKTPVKFGLIITILTVLLSCFFGACWWTASWTTSVNVKLDNILIQNAAAAQLQAKLNDDVAELKAWRKLIDSSGSRQVQETAKEVELLKKDVELHKALDDKRLGPLPRP